MPKLLFSQPAIFTNSLFLLMNDWHKNNDMADFYAASLEVTPKRTEQNLIAGIGKAETEIIMITDCARGIVLLQLTTDGHEASRGLSVTAELFFC